MPANCPSTMPRPMRLLPAILAMAAVVTSSNILVQFRLGEALTWGAITYPFAFLVTDITNRLAGPAAARRVVIVGFAVGVLCSMIAASLGETTIRIATASGTAFLAAQLLDVAIFNRLRQGNWWRAPLVSTLFSASLDTMLFFSIAFSAAFIFIDPADDVAWAAEMVPLLGHGFAVPLWASLGVADWCVKLALAVVALIPFRIIVSNLLARRAEIH